MAGLRDIRERLAEVVGTVRQSAESVSAAAVKSLRATTICPPAPSSRPQRCSKQPRRWTKWAPPVRQNAVSARRADQLAKEAARVAEQGGTVVSNVVNTMKRHRRQ